MSIIITNIGGDLLGISEYKICINDEFISTFKHDRTKGLAECLRSAANAVSRQQWQDA